MNFNCKVAALILVAAASCVGGCDGAKPSPPSSSAKAPEPGPAYQIKKNGKISEEVKGEYRAIETVNFVRAQKYTVTYIGPEKQKNRILFLNVKFSAGEKIKSEYKASVVLLNGVGDLECSQYYSVRVSQRAQAPDPVCVYTAVGDLPFTPVKAVMN
jgi:hypothetical protein